MTDFIIRLEALGRHNVPQAGGKGANLGELAGNAFPVPPGFVIATDACRMFFKAASLSGLSAERTSRHSAEREGQAKQIQEKILNTEIPATLSADILAAYDKLADQSGREVICAVRSSATSEDLAEASFAGQHATYYYVTREGLLTMVRHCWASLWNREAVAYRATHGIDHSDVWMAVVVQEMIHADISGITFTANPVSGSREEVVTEASWGMGAAIVDGRVTPDHYTVAKAGGKILRKQVADKRFMVPPRIDDIAGTRIREVPHALRRKETLTAKLLEVVSHWALKAEDYFGSPQDVEWSIVNGCYFMLQSRPITVMGFEAAVQSVPGRYVVFKPLFENFTDPLTPLTGDVCQFFFSPPLMRLIDQRLYVNLDMMRWLLPLKASDAELAAWLYGFGSDPPRMRISLIKLPLFFCFLFISYLVFGVGFARTRKLPADFMDGFRNFARKIDQDDRSDIQWTVKRLFWWDRIFEPIGNLVFMVNLTSLRYFFFMGLLSKVLRRWVPDIGDEAVALLCSGEADVLSAEMGRDIWGLAKTAKANPAVREQLTTGQPERILPVLQQEPEAADFLNRLNAFLEKNGHRGLKELELKSTRWEEDPAPVLGMIRNYMLVESDADEREKAVTQTRRDLEASVQNALKKFALEKRVKPRWRLIRYLSNRAKYFARLRENSRFYHIMGFNMIRRKIRRIEDDFIQKGKLKCRDDIFFLRVDEIRRMMQGDLDWKAVEPRICERRMEHIHLSKIIPAKSMGIRTTDTQPETGLESGAGMVFNGSPASPGKYEGKARVIMDPATDMELRPGEILVAPYTDPAWTPLFLTAGAAVVEIGSYLSHAGTVAREFGMPCVVDIPDCTTLIQTGASLLVDGSAGVVRILDEGKGDTPWRSL